MNTYITEIDIYLYNFIEVTISLEVVIRVHFAFNIL